MSKAAPRLLALSLALVGWSNDSLGQTPTGTILGSVHDSSGAVVAGAKITVQERDTKLERSVTTNSEGYYEIPLLPGGQYELNAEFTGFKRFSRGNLILSTDQRMEVIVPLTPGDLAETVQVSGDSVLLETTTSSVGQVVDNKKIVDLPLSNRNLLQLQTLVAGVNDFGSTVAPATSGSVAFGRWTANGGMTNTNEFMLDGATAILGNLNAASSSPRSMRFRSLRLRPTRWLPNTAARVAR
jgi:hypothetical protein